MRILSILSIAVALMVWTSLPAAADEVTDQIEEGLKLYKEGKYAQAASELEFAVQQIRQRQAVLLKDLFPDPLSGWKADEPETKAAGAAFFGGGISASRTYYKGGSQIEIEFVSESPLLQSMLMFLSNPMLMAASGEGELVKIKGYKAINKYNANERSGEINIVVANKVLVTVRGSGLEGPDILMDFAKATALEKIERFALQ